MKQWWSKHSINVIWLLTGYVLTTVPFLTKYPYNWDAAQFVLSLENFSIHMHQPHPPGYLLFVGLAKLFNLVVSPHWSFVLESAIFGAVAVVMLYVLTTEFWPERRWLRLITVFAFMLNPLFWFYRETGLTYTIDAAASITLAWLCLGTLRYRTHSYFIASSMVLPLVCGLRPSLLVLVGPLWLLQAWYHKRNWKFVLTWALACLGIALLWVIPLLVLSGGIQAYWIDSSELYGSVSGPTSVFAGAPLTAIGTQVQLMLSTLFYAWNSTVIAMIGSAIIAGIVLRRHGLTAVWKEHSKLFIWALVWVLPATCVYGFIHLGQLGYLVILLPAGHVAAAVSIRWLQEQSRFWLVAVGFGLIVPAVVFLWVKPGYGHPEYRPATAPQHWLQTVARFAPNLFKMNRTVLSEHDATIAAYVELLSAADPATTVLVTVRDVMYPAAANNLPVRNPELFRELSVIAPQFQIIELAPQRDYFLTAQDEAMVTTYDHSVIVSNETRTILIPAHQLPAEVVPTGLIIERMSLPNVTSRYYRGIMDKPWTFLGYTIERPADL